MIRQNVTPAAEFFCKTQHHRQLFLWISPIFAKLFVWISPNFDTKNMYIKLLHD